MDSLPFPSADENTLPEWASWGWRVKCQAFSPGGREIVLHRVDFENQHRRRLMLKASKSRRSGRKSADDVVNLESSRRRAVKQVRLLSCEIGVVQMFTFTTRFKLATLSDAVAAWDRFKREMRVICPSAKVDRWIAVPELHKSGHWHIHAAVPDHFVPVARMRLAWHHALGWKGDAPAQGVESPGNVNVPNLHTRRRLQVGGVRAAARIAGYVSKYISKGDHVDLNRKRYWGGRGVRLLPHLEHWLSSQSGNLDDAVAELVRVFNLPTSDEDYVQLRVPCGPQVVWIRVPPGSDHPPPF